VPAIRATPRSVPDGGGAAAKGATDQVACHCPTCDPVGWLPLVERGEKLRGWVRRGNVVWGTDERVERKTFVLPDLPAPEFPGASWVNLSLAYGWLDQGSEGEECELILSRVTGGQKTCGSFIATTSRHHAPAGRTWPTIEAVRERIAASPEFSLVETPVVDPAYGYLRLCWVCPTYRLGTVVPINEVARWWAQLGCGEIASQVFASGDLWLPDLAECFDLLPLPVTGLVLGYPPESTYSILKLRVCPSCGDSLDRHCNFERLVQNGTALERCELCGRACRSLR